VSKLPYPAPRLPSPARVTRASRTCLSALKGASLGRGRSHASSLTPPSSQSMGSSYDVGRPRRSLELTRPSSQSMGSSYDVGRPRRSLELLQARSEPMHWCARCARITGRCAVVCLP